MPPPQELANNNTTFEQSWDPKMPFETLLDQIETCQEFLMDGNQPYTPQQNLINAYNLVYQSGVYFDGCNEWEETPSCPEDIGNFKDHFLQAQTQLRQQQTMAKQTGYHATSLMPIATSWMMLPNNFVT